MGHTRKHALKYARTRAPILSPRGKTLPYPSPGAGRRRLGSTSAGELVTTEVSFPSPLTHYPYTHTRPLIHSLTNQLARTRACAHTRHCQHTHTVPITVAPHYHHSLSLPSPPPPPAPTHTHRTSTSRAREHADHRRSAIHTHTAPTNTHAIMHTRSSLSPLYLSPLVHHPSDGWPAPIAPTLPMSGSS
jgi:hypothetical protein